MNDNKPVESNRDNMCLESVKTLAIVGRNEDRSWGEPTP